MERGKPVYLEKNLSEQRREPTTNSTHKWRRRQDSTRKDHKVKFFSQKSEKHIRNWMGIVLYISLLMRKIEESQQNNSERGKNIGDVSWYLYFLSVGAIQLFCRLVCIQTGNNREIRDTLQNKRNFNLLIRDLKPALNENVGSEKLFLYQHHIL